jgi:hypothetical protein
MEWTIDYLEKDGIVYIQTSGPADWDANKKMCKKCLALGRSKDTHRYLVDHRKLEHGLSTLQVDDVPRMLKQIGVTPEDKIAIVFDPASPMSGSFDFFRNTSFLESLLVKLFSSPDEAIAWLKSE